MNTEVMSKLFDPAVWPVITPNWAGTNQGNSEYDQLADVDLGCGKVKKGKIGVDISPAPGVNVVMDFDTLQVFSICERPGEDAPHPGQPANGKPWVHHRGLPFTTSSIGSIISHHALEHVTNLTQLVDEVYRVLKPGGIFRAITPLFPSTSAVEDPTHVRYFLADAVGGTWDAFCGTPDAPHWSDSFSVPYTQARFQKVHVEYTPRDPDPAKWWGPTDRRELRVALRANK